MKQKVNANTVKERTPPHTLPTLKFFYKVFRRALVTFYLDN